MEPIGNRDGGSMNYVTVEHNSLSSSNSTPRTPKTPGNCVQYTPVDFEKTDELHKSQQRSIVRTESKTAPPRNRPNLLKWKHAYQSFIPCKTISGPLLSDLTHLHKSCPSTTYVNLWFKINVLRHYQRCKTKQGSSFYLQIRDFGFFISKSACFKMKNVLATGINEWITCSA